MSRTDLVVVKAYGDLVIALAALAHASAEARSRHRILLGAHLVPLFEAVGMAVDGAIDGAVVAHGETGVPACFDVRRKGAWAATRSAWGLRHAIRATVPERLLFDRLTLRERWLAGGVAADALPRAPNIYRAYAEAFGSPDAFVRVAARSGSDIGIFPGSRVARKNLPEATVRAAIGAIEARGLVPRLMLLEGERPDLEASGMAHDVVPRSFAAMIAAVAGCSAIVAADSMPAHVAELRGLPVHVLSPVDNRYWLPHSAFVLDRWSLFDADVAARIGAFLATLEEAP